MVIALSCVAITEIPAAHHGMLRLARKYPSISWLSFVRFSPSNTIQAVKPTRMVQSIQCMWEGNSLDERVLQPPQRGEDRQPDDDHPHIRPRQTGGPHRGWPPAETSTWLVR